MKKADNRNMIAASKRAILNCIGKSPILRAARDNAAKVPGDAAFLIGLMRLSNSSAMQTHSVARAKYSVDFHYKLSFAVSARY